MIHGCAPGADSLAAEWAELNEVAQSRFPADWVKHGRAAGPIRNKTMLQVGKPDMVVAFPGGKGTADMVHKAQAAKVTVTIVFPE